MEHWKLFAAASLITVTNTAGALAFDEKQYQTVKDGQSDCPWCDLSNADLKNVKFSGVNLRNANLAGADLTGAVFTKVDLSGADLTGAVFTGAKLSDTSLKTAELNEVDLSDAVLVGVQLESAYCDFATKLPEGIELACKGVTLQRK